MSILLNGFKPCDKPINIKIKGMDYLVIAYRYDLYGQFTYLYIDQPNGEIKIVIWQDNNDDAIPYHYRVECIL